MDESLDLVVHIEKEVSTDVKGGLAGRELSNCKDVNDLLTIQLHAVREP